MKQFSVGDVSHHKSEDDCWIILNNDVYDVTSFLHEHPGGKDVLFKYAGQDATRGFTKIVDHEQNTDVDMVLKKTQVGTLLKKATTIFNPNNNNNKNKKSNYNFIILITSIIIVFILATFISSQ